MVKNTNPRITILNFYGTKGWEFESLRVHQKNASLCDLLFCLHLRDSKHFMLVKQLLLETPNLRLSVVGTPSVPLPPDNCCLSQQYELLGCTKKMQVFVTCFFLECFYFSPATK